VQEDTVLADTFYLRKGSILQISGGIMHAQERIWGENVQDFDSRRFLPKSKAEKSRQVHPAAFRAFGGGSTLCPGRHFALNEIVGFVAMIVLIFDISGVDGEALQIPEKQDNVVPIHVLEPAKKTSVNMKIREGWKEVAIELKA
jgi:cytochrome P450